MARTAPGVVRYTIHGFMGTHACDNILDYHIFDNGAPGYSRSDAITAAADDIIQNWQSQLMTFLCDAYTVDSISWVDMDTPTGSTGSRPKNGSERATGGQANPSSPPQVAYLVKKAASAGRGTRSGRMYLPAVAEAWVDQVGAVSSTAVTDIQPTLDTFLANTTQGGGLDTYGAQLVVTHFPSKLVSGKKVYDPDATGTTSDVSALTLQTVVATQRRRVRP